MKPISFKQILSVILTLALAATPMPAAAAEWASDLDGHWAAGDIETLYSYGIMVGDGDGAFRPDDGVTRAEFAAMINRSFGYGALRVAGAAYSDVPPGAWYAADIDAASSLGYIVGSGDGTASPGALLPRGHAEQMLSRVLRQPNFSIGGLYSPLVTRGEAASLLAGVLGTVVDGELDADGAEYASVTIRKPGARLSNAVINGDLFITEGVGDGDVWLDNVRIGGRLLAAGGGENSIHVRNVSAGGDFSVDKPMAAGEQPVRFRAIEADSAVMLRGETREVIVAGDIIIVCDTGGEMTVFNFALAQGAKPSVVVNGGAAVGKLTAFVPADIGGAGGVGRLEAHAEGVTVGAGVNLAPDNVEAEQGMTVAVGGVTVVGRGIADPTPMPSDPEPPQTPAAAEATPAPAAAAGSGNGNGQDNNNNNNSSDDDSSDDDSSDDSGGSAVNLGGAASVTGEYRIGRELTVNTSSITGGSAPFIYQWKADGANVGTNSPSYTVAGADAGKTVSCSVTHPSASGAVTALGAKIPYTFAVALSGNESGDAVTAGGGTGHAGDTVALECFVADARTNNRLDFSGVSAHVDSIVSGGGDTRSYTVDPSDAVNGVITLYAKFSHTDQIELSPSGVYTFAAANLGYGQQTDRQVAVKNSSGRATGTLRAALSGDDPLAFKLSPENWESDIAAGKTGSFTVVPALGLGEGTYSAAVTVSGANIEPQSLVVNFTVVKPGGGQPSVGGVTVSPSSVFTAAGSALTRQLTASVAAQNGASEAVAWSVHSAGTTGAGKVTVSEDGLLTVAADASEGTAVIRAASVADNTKYGECAVEVKPLPALGGTASIEEASGKGYRIGATLEVNTEDITGAGGGNFLYQWKANGADIQGANGKTYVVKGADAGKAISCAVTHAGFSGAKEAAGETVPYDVEVSVSNNGKEDGDSVVLSPETGAAGDDITLTYMVANTKLNNSLSFSGVSAPPADVTAADSGTRTYKVSAADADNGVITILAEFNHSALKQQTVSFAEDAQIKTYGNAKFTITATGTGPGAIAYSSGNTSVATVNASTGEVTISGAGTAVITATKAATADYDEAEDSYQLTVLPRPAQITGLDADDKTYDGTTAAAPTGTAVIDGLLNGDDVTVISGTAAFNDANVGMGKTVTFSGYSLGGTEKDNYSLTGQPANAVANIVHAPIASAAITGIDTPATGGTPDTSATADSSANFTVGAVTWSGSPSVFLGGEAYTASVTLTAKPNYTFPSGFTATVNGGNAAVSGSGSAVTLTFTFAKTTAKTLTGIAVKTQPTKLTGYVHGDKLDLSSLEVTLTYSDGTSEEAAPAQFDEKGITASPGDGDVLSYSGNNGKPVEISCGGKTANTGALTIERKPVTVTGLGASDKEYDGNTVAQITGTPVINGKVGNDDVILDTAGGTANFSDKNAGSGKPVIFSGYSLGGTEKDNYTLTQPTGVTANITQKPVTVTGLSASNKVYDGNTVAQVTGTPTINGKVDDDDVTLDTAGGTANFSDKNAGSGKTVIFSGYSLGGMAKDNYTLTQPANAAAAITPGQLTIGAPAGSPTKEYDGTTSYGGSGITLGSLGNKVDGDGVSAAIESATYNSAEVSAANEITIAYEISGTDSGNYLAPANGTIGASITPRQITAPAVIGITAPAAGGTPDTIAALDTDGTARFTVKGVKWSEASAPNTFLGENDTFASGMTYTVSVTLEAESNYAFPSDPDIVATINGNTAGVSGSGSEATLTYQFAQISDDGETITGIAVTAQPTLTYTYGDILDLSSLAVTLTYSGGTTKSVVFEDFDENNITVNPPNGTELSRKNHDTKTVAVTCGTITAPTEPLAVAAKAITQEMLEAIGPQSYTGEEIKPVVIKDGEYTLIEGTDYTVVYTSNIDAGEYAANAEVTGIGNYTTENGSVSATFTISPKQLDFSAAHTKAYDGYTEVTDAEIVTLSGVVEGDNVTVNTVTAEYTSPNAGTKTLMFTAIDLAGDDALNYTVSLPEGGKTVTVEGITQAVTDANNVTWPSDLTAKVGQQLGSIGLTSYTSDGSGKFAWANGETSLEETGSQTFSMIFTPNSTNYSPVSSDVSVDVSAAELGGTATISSTNAYRIGAELTVNTGGITGVGGVEGEFSFEWQADGAYLSGDAGYTIAGADAGKVITCVVTHSASEGLSVTAQGEKVPYDAAIGTITTSGDDTVTLQPEYGDAGDTITLYCVFDGINGDTPQGTVAFVVNNNSEDEPIEAITVSENCTSQSVYTVDPADADGNGKINIDATFTYLSANTSFGFANPKVEKAFVSGATFGHGNDEGDNFLDTGSGSGEITYVSSNTSVAAVTEDGEIVTIMGSGETVITATMAADTSYAEATASYTLVVHSGDGSAESPFLVDSLETLLKVGRDESTSDTEDFEWSLDKHYKQTANIDMAGETWTPIASDSSYPFTGVYDGDGKTITSLTIDDSSGGYDSLGMFAYVAKDDYAEGESGVVKNVKLVDASIIGGGSYVGGVVGHNSYGTVDGCSITGSSNVSGGSSYVGGVVGYNYYGTVRGCAVTGTGTIDGSASSATATGGVVGYNEGEDAVVENCHSEAEVTGYNLGYAGGVVGDNNSGTVRECYSAGSVTGGDYIGGVVGNNSGTVEDCYTESTGTVDGSDSQATVTGGVVGYSSGTVEGCHSKAAVIGYNYVGGVVGHNSSGTVRECFVTGTGSIDGSTNQAAATGGIVGYNENGGTVEYCYSEAAVTGYNNVGGVVGDNNYGTVQNCYSTGDVDADGDNVGGVVGNNSDITRYCYSTSSVSGGYNVGGVAGNNLSMVEHCVALNSGIIGITASSNDIGRVAGTSSSTSDGNYAWGGITPVASGEDVVQDEGNMDNYTQEGKDGESVDSSDLTDANWWSGTAGFTDDWWNGKLPTEMPTSLNAPFAFSLADLFGPNPGELPSDKGDGDEPAADQPRKEPEEQDGELQPDDGGGDPDDIADNGEDEDNNGGTVGAEPPSGIPAGGEATDSKETDNSADNGGDLTDGEAIGGTETPSGDPAASEDADSEETDNATDNDGDLTDGEAIGGTETPSGDPANGEDADSEETDNSADSGGVFADNGETNGAEPPSGDSPNGGEPPLQTEA